MDPAATRAVTYVDNTCPAIANRLTSRTPPPLDEEALRRVPFADETVEHRLERSPGELTAYELAHNHEFRQVPDLPSL